MPVREPVFGSGVLAVQLSVERGTMHEQNEISTWEPRIVVVGRSFPILMLEKVLLTVGATNYICIETLEAAELISGSARRRQIMIVDASLFGSAERLAAFRRQHQNHFVVAIPYTAKNFEPLLKTQLQGALAARHRIAS